MNTSKPTRRTWKYEPATKTIRTSPENYWIATMDSFEGSVDHAANARLIAAAPELLAALKPLFEFCRSSVLNTSDIKLDFGGTLHDAIVAASYAITKAA